MDSKEALYQWKIGSNSLQMGTRSERSWSSPSAAGKKKRDGDEKLNLLFRVCVCACLSVCPCPPLSRLGSRTAPWSKNIPLRQKNHREEKIIRGGKSTVTWGFLEHTHTHTHTHTHIHLQINRYACTLNVINYLYIFLCVGGKYLERKQGNDLWYLYSIEFFSNERFHKFKETVKKKTDKGSF